MPLRVGEGFNTFPPAGVQHLALTPEAAARGLGAPFAGVASARMLRALRVCGRVGGRSGGRAVRACAVASPLLLCGMLACAAARRRSTEGIAGGDNWKNGCSSRPSFLSKVLAALRVVQVRSGVHAWMHACEQKGHIAARGRCVKVQASHVVIAHPRDRSRSSQVSIHFAFRRKTPHAASFAARVRSQIPLVRMNLFFRCLGTCALVVHSSMSDVQRLEVCAPFDVCLKFSAWWAGSLWVQLCCGDSVDVACVDWRYSSHRFLFVAHRMHERRRSGSSCQRKCGVCGRPRGCTTICWAEQGS